MAEETKRKCLFKQHPIQTIVEAIVLFIISYVLLCMSNLSSGFHGKRLSPQKICFGNQRVLLGAIEMYNMDHNEMIKTYDQSIRDLLIKGKYLKSDFMDEVECEFLAEGDLTGTGFIYCVNHGDLHKKKEGKDEFASLTPKRDQIRERNKVLLIIGLLFGPTLLFLIISFI